MLLAPPHRAFLTCLWRLSALGSCARRHKRVYWDIISSNGQAREATIHSLLMKAMIMTCH